MSSSPAFWELPSFGKAAAAMSRSPPACESGNAPPPSTKSFTEIATGWHAFKVEGYSQFKGLLGVARRLRSCPFVVGGHSWCITFFPDGLTADDDTAADWIAFALRLERRRRDGGSSAAAPRGALALAGGWREGVMVRAMFSLLDAAGAPSFTGPGDDVVWTFSSLGESWSHERFMKREEFESTYLKDDQFTIRCDLTVVQEDCKMPPQDLYRQLGELLVSGDGADVTIDVGGEAFRAHRSVLAARSPVFKAVFFGGPHMEHGASRVSVHDIEPSVFRALLHYIYTDLLPKADINGGDRTAMAQHLLVAADRFGIDRLKSICECVLRTPVDRSAVVTTLVVAEQHGCHQLKEECFKVLNLFPDSYKKIVFGENFQYVATTCPSLAQELRMGAVKYF